MTARRPVVLDEVTASKVLSNWGKVSNFNVHIQELVPMETWSAFLAVAGADDDAIAACIHVRPARRRR